MRKAVMAATALAVFGVVTAGCGSSGSKTTTAPVATTAVTSAASTSPTTVPPATVPPGTSAPTTAKSSTTSSTNPTCNLLTVPEIDAAVGTSTGLALGAQADETQTLAQGDCTLHNAMNTNFVEVQTQKGTQGLPEGVSDTIPGVGTNGYVASPTSAPQDNAQCGAKTCEFTAVTNSAGYVVTVSALFTPPVAALQTVAEALLAHTIAKLPA